jgi:Carboxypeptidase regulatory-like domain
MRCSFFDEVEKSQMLQPSEHITSEKNHSVFLKSKNFFILLFCALFVAVFATNPLSAQIDSGGITGTVQDTSGAVIAGAKITLTNDATSVSATTQSTSTGTYVFGGVKPGTYTIDAETNFAPRVGFAYRVNPRTVVRGGYGLAYGALANIGYGGTLGTNYPFI